jgi:Lipase (class 3)
MMECRDIKQLFKSLQISKSAYGTIDGATIVDCSDTGAQAFTWVRNSTRYIVFRGSSELKDFLADLDIRRTQFYAGPGLIHAGFSKQFRSIEPKLSNIMSACTANTIICTGHSLGGALATIAAAVYGGGQKRVVCHTFGSPRVGNHEFADYFKSRVDENARVFNKRDPVAAIPMSFRFQHVDCAISINSRLGLKRCLHDVPWYKRFPKRLYPECHSCTMYGCAIGLSSEI